MWMTSPAVLRARLPRNRLRDQVGGAARVQHRISDRRGHILAHAEQREWAISAGSVDASSSSTKRGTVRSPAFQSGIPQPSSSKRMYR